MISRLRGLFFLSIATVTLAARPYDIPEFTRIKTISLATDSGTVATLSDSTRRLIDPEGSTSVFRQWSRLD